MTETANVMIAMGTSEVTPGNAVCTSYHDKTERVVKMPKRMSDAMFPIRVVPMNQVGFRTKNDMILPGRLPFFPLSSICPLLAERKATSIPDKKIEKINEPTMPARKELSILLFSPSQIIKKKENKREHNGPIGVVKAHHPYLVNANNNERYG